MTDLNLLHYLEGYLTQERKNKFAQILEERTNFFTVAIEDVFQVHNTSAVIRSCDVFGIQTAHVIEERFGQRLDKNIAMGAQKWVDVERHQTTTTCLQHLKKQGYQIVATTPHTNATMLGDFKVEKPTAFFFGTEKEGLSTEVLDNADTHLKIPMVGFSESLNISVAAAIILQSVTEKLKNSTITWQLTEEEKLEKRLTWAKNSIKSIDQIIERFYAEKKS
jgi:tRNA (guanosine-2'-O-)-methyltransferase